MEEEGSEEGSEETSGKIVQFMKENKHITILELAKEISISERTIYRTISKLRKQNKIERIGPDKSGFWQVIDNQ
ncbi:MAG TPA: HTH domain-containing protein [Dysgonamonadaceae bacterium]|nr:HTH domain-containing protein [Dysgonamonadaceae bacterium]